MGLQKGLLKILVMAAVLAGWEFMGKELFYNYFPPQDGIMGFGYVFLSYVFVLIVGVIASQLVVGQYGGR